MFAVSNSLSWYCGMEAISLECVTYAPALVMLYRNDFEITKEGPIYSFRYLHDDMSFVIDIDKEQVYGTPLMRKTDGVQTRDSQQRNELLDSQNLGLKCFVSKNTGEVVVVSYKYALRGLVFHMRIPVAKEEKTECAASTGC